MIVCHCNVIARRDVEQAARDLLATDPWVHLTPGTIYHALGKRGQCCGCFPLVFDLLSDIVDTIRAENADTHSEWAERVLTDLDMMKQRRMILKKHGTQRTASP